MTNKLCITAKFNNDQVTSCVPLSDNFTPREEEEKTWLAHDMARDLAALRAGQTRLKITSFEKSFVEDACFGFWEEPECQVRPIPKPEYNESWLDRFVDWIVGLL